MQPTILEGGVDILPTDAAPGHTHAKTILLLPHHVDNGKAVFSNNTPAVRKLLVEAGLEVAMCEPTEEVRYRDERGLAWLGPVLFFSVAALSSNPKLVSIALGVIANYVTELFRKREQPVTVKLEIIEEIEPAKKYRKVTYDGPVNGLEHLGVAVRASYAPEEPKK